MGGNGMSYASKTHASVLNLPEILEPGRPQRGQKGRSIPRTEEVVGWAPTREIERVCQSREGKWRRAHEWDRDAVCCYCDSRRTEG
jgi:hypothetical protein